MTQNTTTEAEYEQVYEAVREIAARCDGAITEDFKGFNGVDSKFGRRIASVPYSQWTADVKDEAAHIILKYRQQVLAWTDGRIDVGTLAVVKDAQDQGTNYAGRDTARAFERKARNADKVSLRKIDAAGTELSIHYDRKDPEFGELLEACKALPGRHFDWETKANLAPPSPALDDFIQTWDFPVTEAALKLLQAPKVEHVNIKLNEHGDRVIIDTPYDRNLVERIKSLPGRAYHGGSINHADVHPDVVDLAIDFGLKITPDARAACEAALEALEAAEAGKLAAGDRATVLGIVSRLGKPEDVPPVFLSMLEDALGR